MLQVPRAHAVPDLICFSHLRWNFVFQRPQHLMTRCARERRVFFVEEPQSSAGTTPRFDTEFSGGVTVIVPQLPDSLGYDERIAAQRQLVDKMCATYHIHEYVAWYCTTDGLRLQRSPRAGRHGLRLYG